VDGQIKQKKRLVAKKQLAEGLEMGGLTFHTLMRLLKVSTEFPTKDSQTRPN
jgi:hypothetical protein